MYQLFALPSVSALDPHWQTLELVASMIWSNWSVLTIIPCIPKESWSLTRVHFCSDLMMARSWPLLSWQLSPILFIWASVQSLPLTQLTGCSYFFSVFLLNGLYWHLISVQAREAVSRDCVQVRVSHVSPWWAWVQRCLVSGTLWAACSSLIIRLARALMELEGSWRNPIFVTQSWFWFLVLSWACSHCPM